MIITRREYKKYPETYWVGKKVRVISSVESGGGLIFDVGAILKITRKYGGFEVERVDICEHCHVGRRASIGRCNPNHFELIDEVPDDV